MQGSCYRQATQLLEMIHLSSVPCLCPQAKKLESLGFSRQQAEEMTQYLTEQIILDRLRLSERFSAKVELEKVSQQCCSTGQHQH